jgi:hypothetical protein
VLSEHEQRMLEELERRFATEAREPDRPGAARRDYSPPGGAAALLGGVCLLLLLVGVPVAALAIALATALGWLLWCLVAVRRSGGHRRDAAEGRPGDSIRRYLRWLAEAE